MINENEIKRRRSLLLILVKISAANHNNLAALLQFIYYILAIVTILPFTIILELIKKNMVFSSLERKYALNSDHYLTL